MTPRVGATPSPSPAAPAADPRRAQAERLRATARQLEGVFVEQMFKAMRETVPEDGAVSGGSGEAMFSGMLDQSLAEEVPARWSNGLAEALYRQLQRAAGLEQQVETGSGEMGMGNGALSFPFPVPHSPASAPSSPPPALPILDPGPPTSAAPARAVLPEPQ